MNIAPIDILFIIILLFFVIRTAMKGFLAEVMTFAAPIGSLICAALFAGMGAQLLTTYIGPLSWNPIIAFLSIFILTYIIIKIIEKSLENFLEDVNLEKFDKALGVFLGLVEGIALILIIILLLSVQTLFNPSDLFAGSVVFSILSPLVPYVHEIFSQAVGNV